MKLSMIAAVGRHNELGKNNDLIWHFKEDMRFFKQTTTGHSVIMGRKTFESLPKALPNRRNIVISSNENYAAAGAETVTSLAAALQLAADADKAFIIGGGRVYAEALPLADELVMTEIDAVCPDADTFFPAFDRVLYERSVVASHEENDVAFTHVIYTKKAV